MKTISYRETHSYAGSTAGIEVPIRLMLHDRDVRLVAKVDTGASFCIFQRDYAEQLGIDVEAGIRIPVATAVGPFEAYGHDLLLSCLGWVFPATVYFAAPPNFSRNVLGLTGWLQHFRLGVVHEDSTLYLSHYDDEER